jgi:hypothetical protein
MIEKCGEVLHAFPVPSGLRGWPNSRLVNAGRIRQQGMPGTAEAARNDANN